MKRNDFDLLRFEEGLKIDAKNLDGYRRMDRGDLAPLLYHSGYLTIVGYERDEYSGRIRYTLNFPNDEVKYCFLEALLPYYTYRSAGRGF
jgi:hypothetical protein